MRSFFIFLLYTLPVLTILTSCKKSKEASGPQQQSPPVSFDSMLQCYRQVNWDSGLVHDALIGTWNWEFIKCYWNPEDANGEDYKNLSVRFKQNDSLEVRLNNQTTQISSWHIARLNDGYFKINTTPLVLQLPGKVLLCGERVMFYDSYTDGCDNYFKK